jgi:hypothetical protein
MWTGIAEMNATNFRLALTLIPMIQSLNYPGTSNAHLRNSLE